MPAYNLSSVIRSTQEKKTVEHVQLIKWNKWSLISSEIHLKCLVRHAKLSLHPKLKYMRSEVMRGANRNIQTLIVRSYWTSRSKLWSCWTGTSRFGSLDVEKTARINSGTSTKNTLCQLAMKSGCGTKEPSSIKFRRMVSSSSAAKRELNSSSWQPKKSMQRARCSWSAKSGVYPWRQTILIRLN